jgi:hypothetical protein
MTDGASELPERGDACPNSWFGRHKFEARYDIGPPDLSRFVKIDRASEGFFEALKPKTYVRDVCVKCGKTIERAK